MPKFLRALFFLPFFLAIGSSNATAVHMGGAELLNAKAYSVNLETSVFQSASVLDQDRVEQSFADSDKFRMIDGNFKISYGLSRNLETSLLFRARAVSAVNQGISASATGPESAGVEAKYGFDPIGNIRYALGLYYRQTLYTNTVYATQATVPTDTIILGDDGTEYGVGIYATANNHPWKLDMSMIYVSPPNDLSSEIHYNFEGIYFLSKLSFLGGIGGVYSMNKDLALSKPILARGPSNMFNSLNREFMAPYLGFNYAFEKTLFYAKASTIVSGRSTDKGSSAILGLKWSSEGETAESLKVNSFKEYHIEGSVLKVSARGNFIKIYEYKS